MTAVPQRCIEDDLAEHAAAIRVCNKRVIEDIAEIGRHLTEAKAAVGHGNFGRWIAQEFSWSDRTARNYMGVYEMALNRKHVSDLKLSMRELYLLAAPSTPEEARDEIIERAAAGEQMTGAEVREAITRVKREKDGTAETETAAQVTQDGTAETAAQDDAAVSAEASDAPPPPAEPEADPAPPAPAPNPAATAAAAVNALTPTELRDFLERLWPAPRRAFELKFGARNSAEPNGARLPDSIGASCARSETAHAPAMRRPAPILEHDYEQDPNEAAPTGARLRQRSPLDL
jgi:hypothetical protein